MPFSFQSSTDAYKSGLFNETIKKIIKNYDEIINIVLPTLGEERRKSYSPFFPISEITGKILQVPIELTIIVFRGFSYDGLTKA